MDPRITFDFHGRCIIRRGRKINLTGKEFKLMSRLMDGQSVSMLTLSNETLKEYSRLAVYSGIQTLRRKLEGPEKYPEMIRTRADGYRLSIENMYILD